MQANARTFYNSGLTILRLNLFLFRVTILGFLYEASGAHDGTPRTLEVGARRILLFAGNNVRSLEKMPGGRFEYRGGMLPKIKYIAAYQSQPISAITHVAPVARIEPYGDTGKYKLIFSEPAKAITRIPFGDAPSGFMQGPRYTTYEKLMTAKKVTDLIVK